jgi:tetratricopeptide (TPR) repeat protein
MATASSARISYPLVWGVVFAMLVAVGLGAIVVTRTQTASTPHTPSELNLQGWQNVVKNNPNNSGAELQLGYAYYDMAHHTNDATKRRALLVKALAAYDVSLNLNSTIVTTQYNRAMVLQELGRTDEAVAQYEKIITQTAGLTIATHDVGMIYLARGDVKMAVKRLTEVVRVNPSISSYRVDLAKAFIKAGKTSQARAQLTFALSMDPQNSPARSMLASLTPKPKGGAK